MSVVIVAAAMTMMVVQMIGVLDIEAARHHEDVAVRPHDMDIGAIEPGKDRRRHGLVDSDGADPFPALWHRYPCRAGGRLHLRDVARPRCRAHRSSARPS